jgi:uncharacterized protein YbgA (DUF1722 family)/uncharacterized protein YbbK (DUF523 family)
MADASAFIRPRLVVSACLNSRRCRWDGAGLDDPVLSRLAPFVDLVPVCPEEEIGLGTPRAPVRLVRLRGGIRMVQPDTGADLTADMEAFAHRFLAGLRGPRAVDGFLLKSRSPSCGVGDTRIHQGTQRGAGLFGAAVKEAFPGLAVEDEGRLLNFNVRDHFLSQVFALARLRELGRSPSASKLVAFQARHKLLLMAYSRRRLDACGRLVANPARRPPGEVYQDYAREFAGAFARPARPASHVNVIQHGLGYVSARLTPAERRHFLTLLERYRRGTIPLASPLSVLRSWIVRFEVAYLEQQVYFQPYPEDLVDLMDSGKGRPL